MTETVPVSIRWDVTTLRRSAMGSITGNIQVELGTFTFPGQGWSDFVVVILGWWLDALASLVQGRRTVELLFMDGPYAISVTALDPFTGLVECVRKGSERTVVVWNGSVDLVELVRETERAAAQVLGACDTREWLSGDVDRLRKVADR